MIKANLKPLIDKLIRAIKHGALIHGDFVLSSGIKSNYFVDMSNLTHDPNDLQLIVTLINELTRDVDYDVIGGVALGACPIVSCLGMMTGDYTFYIRREPKFTIVSTYIEGILTKDQDVLLIEDVITTGAQTMMAIERIKDQGNNVIAVVCVLDRSNGSFKPNDIPFISLVEAKDLGL